MKKIWIASVLLLLLDTPAVFSQTTWKAYEYNVSFKIKNAGVNVNGKFSNLKSDLKFSPDKLASSSLKGTVEVGTVNTGIAKRDKDIKEEKYFNADKYKLIEVASTKLYKKGNGYAGMFNVTIKGTTKQIEIPFDFNRTGDNAEFNGSFTIHRSDFGIGGKTLTMSDDADVSLMVKAKASGQTAENNKQSSPHKVAKK